MAIFLSASPVLGAATLVQSKCYQGSGSEDSHTLTFDNATTSGNLIVVFAATSGEALGVSATTDTETNSWTQAALSAGANSETAIYYTTTNLMGASHAITVNPSGTSVYIDQIITEWSGITLSSADAQNIGAGVGTAVSGSITPTVRALIVGGMEHENGTVAITETETLICEDQDGADYPYSVSWKIVDAGATTMAWTIGASTQWRASVAAFVETAGGGGAGPSTGRRVISVIGN